MIRSYGFLRVEMKSNYVGMSFNGNMGNTLKDVEYAFDQLFGKGKFRRITPYTATRGSPDYSWVATCDNEDFKRVVGPVERK